MRKLMPLMFVMLAACGGGSPTGPSQPVTVPTAHIVTDGDLTFDRCAGSGCTFSFNVRNNGPGCAGPDLAGTVTITMEDGTTTTAAEWELTLGSRQSTFLPNTVKRATNSLGERLRIPNGNGTYSIRITRQTNIRCS